MKYNLENKLSKYKKVGILGLGITGNGVYNFFCDNNIDVVCWDESEKARKIFGSLYGNAKMLHFEEWGDCSHIVVSPGIPLFFPEVHAIIKFISNSRKKIILTTDVEILYHLIEGRAKIIAVTGTNGKSTTTALITHILKASGMNAVECGNIGVSALAVPLDKDIYVLELSSYQLESLSNFRANIAVFLNLTPDHLERHGDIEYYRKAKTKIFQNQKKEDYAIIGIDNPITAWVLEEQKDKLGKCLGISYNEEFNRLKNIITFDNNIIQDNFYNSNIPIEDNIYLPGKHNRENICAAYAATRVFGLDVESIIPHILTFKGLPHRMEFIGQISGISFYNDSKSTNADSARPALESLKNIYWIVGGVPKAGGIHPLRDCLEHVRKIYIFGAAVKDFSRTLESVADFAVHQDLDAAFSHAFKDAIKESKHNRASAILLSPACSSFDQYTNFEERGKHFVELFHTYQNRN